MNTQDLITEFNQNREANLKALLVKYTPACGEIKSFLKVAMNALIDEDYNTFDVYESKGLQAAIEYASLMAFYAMDPVQVAATRKEESEYEMSRRKANSSVKTYGRYR